MVNTVSFVVPVSDSDDLFLVGTSNFVSLLQWDGRNGSDYTLDHLYDLNDNRTGTNDAKVDARGRLWVGTLKAGWVEDAGSLYRIDDRGSVKMIDRVQKIVTF